MHVQLDSERCQGHGRCYTIAPQLFGYDDAGYAVLLLDGEVPPNEMENARLAVANCPEYAISLESDG